MEVPEAQSHANIDSAQTLKLEAVCLRPSHWLVLYRLAMTFVTMVSFQAEQPSSPTSSGHGHDWKELCGIAVAMLHVSALQMHSQQSQATATVWQSPSSGKRLIASASKLKVARDIARVSCQYLRCSARYVQS